MTVTANVTNSNAALKSKYYTTMGTDLIRRALFDVRLLYVSLDAMTLTAVNKNRDSRQIPRRANLLSDSTYFSPPTHKIPLPLKLRRCRLIRYVRRER